MPVWGNALLRRRIILGTFVSLALISFVGGIFVDYYFSQHNPRRPEPEVGRTYWVTADKVEVYVTKYELIGIHPDEMMLKPTDDRDCYENSN